jgi:3-oxoadipate enol-lactonase
MDFVKVDEDVLLARRDGEPAARALVFANALGTDLRVWDRLVRYLADRFHLVRYDMRGHGLSTLAARAPDLEILAGDLATVMDQLDTGPAVVVGCELGAQVALTLARRRPELAASLVLMGGAARLDTPELWNGRGERARAGGLDAVADDVLAEWLPEAFRRQRPDETRIWRAMLTRTPAAAYAAGADVLAGSDVGAAARGVTVPSLVLAGAAAGPARLEASTALAQLIDGSAETRVSDAALLAHVAQPAPVAAAILGFLESRGVD